MLVSSNRAFGLRTRTPGVWTVVFVMQRVLHSDCRSRRNTDRSVPAYVPMSLNSVSIAPKSRQRMATVLTSPTRSSSIVASTMTSWNPSEADGSSRTSEKLCSITTGDRFGFRSLEHRWSTVESCESCWRKT